MKRVVCAVLLLMILVTSVAAEVLPKPEALSEETILISEKLSTSYDTLVIREFTSEGVEYSRVDDAEKAKILNMLPLLKSNITLTLESELKSRNIFKKVVKGDVPINNKAVILEGAFSEFNAGSRALKFFVGFGSGKVYIKFKGRLIDAQTGKELALFEDRETGYRGAMTLESFEDLFPHQAKSIGQNLAVFLEKLY